MEPRVPREQADVCPACPALDSGESDVRAYALGPFEPLELQVSQQTFARRRPAVNTKQTDNLRGRRYYRPAGSGEETADDGGDR